MDNGLHIALDKPITREPEQCQLTETVMDLYLVEINMLVSHPMEVEALSKL